MNQRVTNHLIFQRRYNVLDGREVAKRITEIFEKQCPLTDYQKDWLRRELGDGGFYGNLDMPFQAYEWGKNPRPKSVLQRISIPIAILLNIIMFLTVCPLKWFFTGRFTFDTNDGITRWLYNFTTFALDEQY